MISKDSDGNFGDDVIESAAVSLAPSRYFLPAWISSTVTPDLGQVLRLPTAGLLVVSGHRKTTAIDLQGRAMSFTDIGGREH